MSGSWYTTFSDERPLFRTRSHIPREYLLKRSQVSVIYWRNVVSRVAQLTVLTRGVCINSPGMLTGETLEVRKGGGSIDAGYVGGRTAS